MPFKIRTKLIVAFLAMLAPFMVVYVANYYLAKAVHTATHVTRDMSNELENLADLQLSIQRLLMPVNDYLITGEIREKEKFRGLEGDVERYIGLIRTEKRCQGCHPAVTDEMIKRLHGTTGLKDKAKEMELFKEIAGGFEEIKKKAAGVFGIEKPVGTVAGANLMTEMDVIGDNLIEGPVARHREVSKKELEKAVQGAEKAWLRFLIVRTLGYIIAIAIGIYFSLFYSGLFVRPIEKLHHGADAIAGGDFKSRVDVKTGDEIEQLANGMNEMAEKLDDFYGSLEDQVNERTKELRESEERFRNLAEQMPNMVFINKGGRVVYANIKCEEVMRYKREEFYSPDFNFLNIIAPEYMELAKSKFTKHIKGEDVEPYEYAIITKDGKRIEAMLNSILIDYKGERAILGIITDITERKRAEDELAKHVDELERYMKATVQREFRIKELRDRVEELEKRLKG